MGGLCIVASLATIWRRSLGYDELLADLMIRWPKVAQGGKGRGGGGKGFSVLPPCRRAASRQLLIGTDAKRVERIKIESYE